MIPILFNLNDIRVCSKTIEVEVGQILQYLQNSYKAEGEARQ